MMEHRRLGQSELELPVVTFGAWAIGGLFWGGTDDAKAIEAIHAAIDHGVDAIDTAPIYGCGHSERTVGKAIRGRRDHVRILTKCSLRWDSTEGEFYFTIVAPDGDQVACYKNVTAQSLMWECEQSLKRLATDVIDLYQVHWPSQSAPAAETMGALLRLKEQGKIREIGVSNYNNTQLAEALRLAPIVSNQIRYNLLERDIETDQLPFCQEHDVGVICYSPMAMGLLTGKVTMDRTFVESDIRSNRPWFQLKNRKQVLAALKTIHPIADAHNITLAQLTAAWIIGQKGVTTALIGARNAQQAAENAVAGEVILTPEELRRIRQTFEALGTPES